MKKASLLFVALTLLNSCAMNNILKDERGLFCTLGDYSGQDFLYLDTNNVFEAECIFKELGTRQYYCKGRWSHVSKKIIALECDNMDEWDLDTLYSVPPLGWNPYFGGKKIKVVSGNKVIVFQEDKVRYVLKSEWCDCPPKYVTPIIQCDSTLIVKSKKRR